MKRDGHKVTQACEWRYCCSMTGEEEYVEEDQRHAQVDVDFDRGIFPGFSVGQNRLNHCQQRTHWG